MTSPEAPSPRANPNLVGQEHAERRLVEIWRSGRIPHGWLITGPAGIGKATLAYRFARHVLANRDAASGPTLFGQAEALDSLQLDAAHPVFRRVASGGHADFMVLERLADPDSGRFKASISVEQVRAAGQFLSLTPGEGGWRVVLIDAADELNANAANALLKMLEEPPTRALLLLVCHSLGSLPATVRSRCCRLVLAPLDGDVVRKLLAEYRPDIEPAKASVLARIGEGSIGRAMRIADEGGIEFCGDLVAIMRRAPNFDVAAIYGFADRIGRSGHDTAWRTGIELLLWWIARLIRTGARNSAGDPMSGGEIVDGEAEAMSRLLALAGLDRWTEVWEKIGRLAALADHLNLDRKQVALNAFHALEQAMRA